MLNREQGDEIFFGKILFSFQIWEQCVGLVARKERKPDIGKDADVADSHQSVLPGADRVRLSADRPAGSLFYLKDVRSDFEVDKQKGNS